MYSIPIDTFTKCNQGGVQMNSLTALMFVVYFGFILAVVNIKPLSDALIGTNQDTGESHPVALRIIGGAVYFPICSVVLFCLGWLMLKLGGFMLLPFQYLYNLLPTT
ncbi:MAG: hypothetical protein NUW02_00225 [Candidatus Campbellbacteria bacterium]|nr:hypothetical protein [Candidatus Campbellbacteria bacterium]